MIRHITNNKGEIEVDPHAWRHKYHCWLNSVTKNGQIDYHSFTNISAEASELLTKYILDMAVGKNTARGTKRGPRSFGNLYNIRMRLHMVIQLLEHECKKPLLTLNEDDVLRVFQAMREGRIHSKINKPFLSVSTYAKKFAAFWRWYLKAGRKDGAHIPDLVIDLDTGADAKPKWVHFTLKDVEKMAEVASDIYYRTLVYFLFDSGIRAPKELMNVRVMDIAPVPNSNQLFLTIRDETSKTFGRKIKLMLSSDYVRKYIAHKGLSGQDFLFTQSYAITNRRIAYLGHKALGIGTLHRQAKTCKPLVRGGITMYDFRHNSVCYYLPIYKSENQMKYRYGWKKADMIHYYSEYIGMKDTITEDDMLIDGAKTEIQQQLQREQMRVAVLEEKLATKEVELDNRFKEMEVMLLQKFADHF